MASNTQNYIIRPLLNQFFRQPFTLASARALLLHPQLSYDDAQKVVQHIRNANQQSPAIYKHYLTGFARRGDEAGFTKAQEQVKALGLPGDWRDMQALMHAQKKELQPTIDLLSTFVKEGIRIDAHDFGFCLGRLAKEDGACEKFGKVYEEMIASGIKPNVIIGNAFVRAYAQQGDSEGVKRAIEQIKSQGFHCSTPSYAVVIDSHVKKGDIEGAQNWLAQMRADGVTPDANCFTPLIDYLFRKEDFAGMQKHMEEMIKGGVRPEARAFARLINHKMRGGNDAEGGQHWYQEMMRAGYTPNPALTQLVQGQGVEVSA